MYDGLKKLRCTLHIRIWTKGHKEIVDGVCSQPLRSHLCSSLSWEKAQFHKLRKKIGSKKTKGNHSNKALIRPFRKDY
ncbi:BnaC07g51000D [Brassica napus]|uniref:(rape) hypothetical protein n=1 Tax=Brassica napus TaxID=3708 RepID=A0A078J939_BRANA|nr:unnamed protein product [Brassica napus]CDY63646.1 BnaC07g51000D [Brassica napus]